MNSRQQGDSTGATLSEQERDSKKENYPGIWMQYYATFAVCVASFASGASAGWFSPMLMILKTEASPVGKMTNIELSPLETLPAFASLAGTPLFAGLIDKLGRKMCGYVSTGVAILGGLFLLFATAKYHLYVGRFLVGFAGAGFHMLGPIYLSEIAYTHVRGALMTYTHFAAHSGSLLSFILGTVLGYRLFTAICFIGTLLFPLFFTWLPESPAFLLLNSRENEARSAFLWYRGGMKDIVEEEILMLSKVTKSDLNTIQVLRSRVNRKAITISLFIGCFSVLSGVSVIVGYASQIFEEAQSALSPNTSAAIMASVKFFASLTAVQLVDRIGRRILVIFSFISMSATLVILTSHLVAQEIEADVLRSGWIPIICLNLYELSFTLGAGTVGEIILTEMLTPEVKGVAFGIVGISRTMLNLGALQAYALFDTYIGAYFNFLVESIFAILAVVISFYLVPETKGKTFAEITEMLNGYTPHINKKERVTKL